MPCPRKGPKKGHLFLLGILIEHAWVKLLHPQIRSDNLQTLNDFQKLLDDINWIQPTLRLTTGELKPLFGILRGN
jgi:hypothetical protein